MSKARRSRRQNAGSVAWIGRRTFELEWRWWKLVYLYGGLLGGVAGVVGFGMILYGWVGAGWAVAVSTIVVRRVLFWIDVLRVEPRVGGRMLEVMRLDRFILTGGLSIKRDWISLLIAACVLGSELGGVFGATFFVLVYLTEFAPPFVLFLGNSERSYDLFQRVAAGCVPHRVITLLRQDDWGLDKWRARTADPAYWREMVQALARCACVVVLDGRFPTDPLNEECDWLLVEGLSYKLVVVGHSSRNCPVLSSSWSRLNGTTKLDPVVVITPEAIQWLVNVLAQTSRHVPRPAHPASMALTISR